MSVLWAGGEDIDFPGTTFPMVITAGRFRSGYGRCAFELSTAPAGYTSRSNTFPGGAITSGWFSCQYYQASTAATGRFFGLGKYSSTNKGLFVGGAAAGGTKTALITYDGSSAVEIATESGNSLGISTLHKIDMQVTGYDTGGSANTKVYVDTVLVINYTGDPAVSGVTDLDCVMLSSTANNRVYPSEIIVADQDTRTFSLVTLYPNGAGSLLEWTGAYSTIDEISLSDADLAYSNTTGQKAQYALNDTPAGQFSVPAAMVSFRGCKTSGASIEKIKSGVLSSSTEDLDAGQTMTTSWGNYNRLMTQINSAQITTAILDAMELDFNSLT